MRVGVGGNANKHGEGGVSDEKGRGLTMLCVTSALRAESFVQMM